MNDEVINLKVTFVGDTGSGKTCLISRYISDSFNPDQDPTIGASYFSKIVTVKDKVLRLSIWDTAGQERFDSISSLYCRNSNAIILVCDVRSVDSIGALDKWYNRAIKENRSEDVPVLIAVNKFDLATEEHEEIIRKIEEFGDKIHAPVIRTSANSNQNVEELFNRLVRALVGIKSSMNRKSIALSSRRHSGLIELKNKQKCC